MITAPSSDLLQGYEALRARAVGEIPAVTPRGLAIFMRCGAPAWMVACAPEVSSASTTSSACPNRAHRGVGTNADLVRLLTEMVLSTRQRSCA